MSINYIFLNFIPLSVNFILTIIIVMCIKWLLLLFYIKGSIRLWNCLCEKVFHVNVYWYINSGLFYVKLQNKSKRGLERKIQKCSGCRKNGSRNYTYVCMTLTDPRALLLLRPNSNYLLTWSIYSRHSSIQS